MKDKDERFNTGLKNSIARMNDMVSGDDFVEPETVAKTMHDDAQLHNDAERYSHKILFNIGLVNKELKSNIRSYLDLYSSFRRDVDSHNDRLASDRISGIGRMINPVEGRELDCQQLKSIALDLHTRLVLAGAGTGKTTTIVGFIKYLLASGKADPEEILALSFTNATVDELKKRIQAETGQRVETTTFHRLGIKVIASSEGKVPKISNTDLRGFISDEIKRKRTDLHYVRLLNDYLVFDFDGQRNETSFATNSDYAHYLKENPLITLKGEKVKSFGEADIANFLAMNGVPYEYESSYEVDTNDSRYGQYHPDFHLTGTNIYIEYFGIDRHGNVAPFMIDRDPNASKEYLDGIEWKRTIHRDNNTSLIELYAYNRSDDVLQDMLTKKLAELSIQLHPVSPDEVFDDMLKCNSLKFNSAVSSFTTILTLMKGTGKTWEEAYPKGNFSNRRKLKRLEELLRPLYDAYQGYLRDNNEIDFEDMLNVASGCIDRGRYHHPYRYVIVDEYQDMSESRFNLLRSMRQDRDFRMYCVGDDWQSIYRFNGSNVSYILDFERYWGPSAVCMIETTYRFNGDLLRLSSEFMCANKRQYQKQLRGVGSGNCPVRPIQASSPSSMRYRIGEVLKQLPESSSVLFLGRYNQDIIILEKEGYSWKPEIGSKATRVFYSPRRDLDMRFMTIHGSKGLQADYVISLNNNVGTYGFPSNRNEPPVIKLLLGSDDSQQDEERRLFYVAMTRAKKGLYLASYYNRQSTFFKEIFKMDLMKGEEMYCPICRGQLMVRKGRYGQFYGCENFPSCRFTRRIETDGYPNRRK